MYVDCRTKVLWYLTLYVLYLSKTGLLWTTNLIEIDFSSPDFLSCPGPFLTIFVTVVHISHNTAQKKYFITLVPDNIFSSRILCVSSSHELLHLVDIERSHDLRKGEVLCDRSGYSDLIDPEVRVRGDYSTSWEINTFSHQVSSDPSFFTLHNGVYTFNIYLIFIYIINQN